MVTLVRYTGLSERTVRTCLDRLAAEGIIPPCDPGVVAARIKRADRRPQGWDLNLSLIRDDLTEAGLAALVHHFPGLAARVAVVACPDAGGAADGLQSPHPARAVDDRADGGAAVAQPGGQDPASGLFADRTHPEPDDPRARQPGPVRVTSTQLRADDRRVRGLRPVAAALIYRLVNSKSTVTAVLLAVHHSICRPRERPAA